MTLRSYLLIMSLGAGLSWLAWGLVLFNINPFETTRVGILFFYTSLCFALVGTISLGRFFWYHFFSTSDLPMFRYVEYSFRDAIIITVILIGLLYLRGQALLKIWNLLAFLVCVILLILFRHTTRRDSPQHQG